MKFIPNTLTKPMRAWVDRVQSRRFEGIRTSEQEHLVTDLSLSERIDSCPLYRKVATKNDFDGESLCVCCVPSDVPEAAAFFQEEWGLNPDHWAVIQWRQDSLRGVRPSLSGRNIVPLAELAKRRDLSAVVWVRRPRERTFTRLLAEYGLRNFCFWSDPNYSKSLSPRDYFERNREKLEEVYEILEDTESKETFASVLRSRRESDCGYLRVASYPEYEHPSVHAELNDVVVDVGGYDGRTSLRYAERVGAEGKVFCFEPVSANLALVETTLNELKGTKIKSVVQIVPMGVSDGPGEANISIVGGSSKVEGSGGMAAGPGAGVETIKLTDLSSYWLENRIDRLDLISLDIEGLEMAALAGAEQIIRKFRPKLQVSLYHKPEDLYELTLWIRDLDLDYRFFMGHHDSYLVETDLYAIAR